MFTWIVHVYHEPINLVVRTDIGNISTFCRYNKDVKFSAADIGSNQYADKIETFSCRNKEEAEALAKVLAQQVPNTSVYVAELKSIVVSKPTAPTVASVTEKGIVPR